MADNVGPPVSGGSQGRNLEGVSILTWSADDVKAWLQKENFSKCIDSLAELNGKHLAQAKLEALTFYLGSKAVAFQLWGSVEALLREQYDDELLSDKKFRSSMDTRGTPVQSGSDGLVAGIRNVSLNDENHPPAQFHLEHDVTITVLHHDDRNDSTKEPVQVTLKKSEAISHTYVKRAIKSAVADDFWLDDGNVERVWQATRANGELKRTQNIADMTAAQLKEAVHLSVRDNIPFLWFDQNKSPPSSPQGSGRNSPEDTARLNEWASKIQWAVPKLSPQRRFKANDGEVSLEAIGREFPLLDREKEMDLVLDEMEKACEEDKNSERGRNRTQYCFGGVSGSGKTRFAREIAPRFNEKYRGKFQAYFCRINCSLFATDINPVTFSTTLLVALLEESGLDDEINIGNGKQWLKGQPQDDRLLGAILELTKVENLTTITVVNLDEAQHLKPQTLLNLIKFLRNANVSAGRSAQFWPLPTGLNVEQFINIRTMSYSRVEVQSLKPVRNMKRAFDETFNIEKVKMRNELDALLVSLDGIPRLLWAAIAAFSGIRKIEGGIGETHINITNVLGFLANATEQDYGSLYRAILSIISQATTFFASLSSMFEWTPFPGLLACLISGCPVNLNDNIGSDESRKSISEIAAAGWAMLIELPKTADDDDSRYRLELPLLYFHSDYFDRNEAVPTRRLITVMRSPQKPLRPDDAEELDRSILTARTRAYSALGKSQITIKELLGGDVEIPQQFDDVSLTLGTGTIIERKGTGKDIVSEYLQGNDDSVACSFMSQDKLSFADSGIIFRQSNREFAKIQIQCTKPNTRSATPDVFKPAYKNSFTVFIQSKRFLSQGQGISEQLALEEFEKVKATLSDSPFVLVIVTDKQGQVEFGDDNLQRFVSVLGGEKLPSFLGSMLARRRAAAAEVAKQDMKHPDTKRNLLTEFC